MIITKKIAEYRALSLKDVGFIPTMGALHAGHLSLIEAARAHKTIALSIFVNPLQFGPNEDYTRYPRPLALDLEKAESAGVDVVFLPSVEEMYDGSTTKIEVGEISRRWEGEHRPGHFDGVATVVCKLFNIIRPETAYFGLKDFQQCAVVSKMVADLNIPLSLRFCETLRETDGLAMSSRNEYLTPEIRVIAPQLPHEMKLAKQRIIDGKAVESTLSLANEHLAQSSFKVDYFSYVSAETLEPLNEYHEDSVILSAVRLGGVRLIDNLRVA